MWRVHATDGCRVVRSWWRNGVRSRVASVARFSAELRAVARIVERVGRSVVACNLVQQTSTPEPFKVRCPSGMGPGASLSRVRSKLPEGTPRSWRLMAERSRVEKLPWPRGVDAQADVPEGRRDAASRSPYSPGLADCRGASRAAVFLVAGLPPEAWPCRRAGLAIDLARSGRSDLWVV